MPKAHKTHVRGFRGFRRGDNSRLSSLKETSLTQRLGAPSLKRFPKGELNWVASGNIFLTGLTTGICHPLLVGCSWCYRRTYMDLQVPDRVSYQAPIFRSRTSRSQTFPFSPSLTCQFWKYFDGPNHSASA